MWKKVDAKHDIVFALSTPFCIAIQLSKFVI